jgi:hypothetical protein
MASIGAIVGGALRLIRDHPGRVVAWAVAYCAGAFAVSLLVSYLMLGYFSIGDVTPYLQRTSQASGLSALGILLLYLALGLLVVMLMNAVFRTVLRPDIGGFAGIRLGMAEFRMLGLVVLFTIVFTVLVIVYELVLFLLMAVVGVVFGQGTVSALISILLLLAFIGGVIWAQVRLSLIFPLSFYRGRITVDEAWDLTRGRFWTLFGSYLTVMLVGALLYGALMWVMLGDYLIAVAQAQNDPERVQAAMLAFAAKQAAMPLAAKIGMGLLGTLLFAIGLALGPGLLASATGELLAERGELAGDPAESDQNVLD